jgi:high-affinity nickel-transport protein
LSGGVWDAVAAVNERFGMLGYGIVSLFMLCWIGSILFHRWRKPAPLSR